LWNAFIERVDADSIALDERTKRHRQLLDDNLRWQRQVEEMAGRHEQRIGDLEKNLEEKEIYINNMECALATLTSRMDAMEDRVCRCNEVQVEEEEDPLSELSYEEEYFTPNVRVTRMIEDVPRLVPVGEVEVTVGDFDDVRDGDVKPDSVASQVAEQVLHTGGEGQYTQWVHYEFIVGSETICLAHTQQVNSGHFQKVPTHLPSPNPAGK